MINAIGDSVTAVAASHQNHHWARYDWAIDGENSKKQQEWDKIHSTKTIDKVPLHNIWPAIHFGVVPVSLLL